MAIDLDFEKMGFTPDPVEDQSEKVDIDGLGSCDILKIHDDGDLTVKCGGKKFMVTSEGDIFEEKDKSLLTDPLDPIGPLESE